MKTLVFFVEGPSEMELLRALGTRLLPPEVEMEIKRFRGKQDLEANLVRLLRGWRKPDSAFVILRDQDAEQDCRRIKEKLTKLCRESGKSECLVRIACRELESFFLGDLAAVERGLDVKGLGAKQGKQKFRNPDELRNPADELALLIGKPYSKIAGARAIAPCLDLDRNTSRSFNALISGIRRLAAT